jgi:hypothetical protein
MTDTTAAGPITAGAPLFPNPSQGLPLAYLIEVGQTTHPPEPA